MLTQPICHGPWCVQGAVRVASRRIAHSLVHNSREFPPQILLLVGRVTLPRGCFRDVPVQIYALERFRSGTTRHSAVERVCLRCDSLPGTFLVRLLRQELSK